jgi:hypothetical protein
MKFFAFYVGGDAPGSNIELHDVRFAVGEKMEDCYGSLRAQWWGTPESLHIDCWMDLTHADGYEVSLRPEPFAGPEQLFFLNLGGYDKEEFGELHRNVFIVETDKKVATKKSILAIKPWKMPHRDAVYEVEKIVELSELAASQGLHVHLTSTPDHPPVPFVTGLYIKLGEGVVK